MEHSTHATIARGRLAAAMTLTILLAPLWNVSWAQRRAYAVTAADTITWHGSSHVCANTLEVDYSVVTGSAATRMNLFRDERARREETGTKMVISGLPGAYSDAVVREVTDEYVHLEAGPPHDNRNHCFRYDEIVRWGFSEGQKNQLVIYLTPDALKAARP